MKQKQGGYVVGMLTAAAVILTLGEIVISAYSDSQTHCWTPLCRAGITHPAHTNPPSHWQSTIWQFLLCIVVAIAIDVAVYVKRRK